MVAGTWLRVTGLVGVVVTVACSGATTGGNRDGELSVAELRAQAREQLGGVGDSLVPASEGGWAFAGALLSEDPATWLYASLLGTDAGSASPDDVEQALKAATEAATGPGSDRAAAFAVVHGLEHPQASAVAPAGAGERLLAAAQVHIDAGDLDWIGVVATLAAGVSPQAGDAREALTGLTGSEGRCADLDPYAEPGAELPESPDELIIPLSRLSAVRATCPQAIELLGNLLASPAWQEPDAAYDLTLALRVTPESVQRDALAEQIAGLARAWVDGPLVPLPSVYESRLLLAAAGQSDPPVSDELGRRLEGQIASQGRQADFVDGTPPPTDLVVEEQLAADGEVPAGLAGETRQALIASPPTAGNPAQGVALSLMVGKNLPSCADAAVIGTGSPATGGMLDRIGAETAAVVALECSGVLDVDDRLNQIEAETDYATRAARSWAVAYTTCLLPDVAVDPDLARDLKPVGPDRDQPFLVYARAFLADPAGECAALAQSGILPTASA